MKTFAEWDRHTRPAQAEPNLDDIPCRLADLSLFVRVRSNRPCYGVNVAEAYTLADDRAQFISRAIRTQTGGEVCDYGLSDSKMAG